MKKTCLIAVYFGDFPYYFPLFKESCYKNNEIQWIIFNDSTTNKEENNIKYVNISLENLSELASKYLRTKIDLKRPYKVCDLRPIFPIIFEEYIKGYDFWGHCDIDVIWGDISKFLNYDYVWKNDIITADRRRICGPFSLFKVSDKMKYLYKDIENYSKILNSENSGIIDELEFHAVNEPNRCTQTIDITKYKIFCGHAVFGDFVSLQRYSTERTPAYWKNGKLFIEKYFKNLVVDGNDFHGFGAETMMLHVRKWHYVDCEKKSIHHKNEDVDILKKWANYH